jgi:hypothetical protein
MPTTGAERSAGWSKEMSTDEVAPLNRLAARGPFEMGWSAKPGGGPATALEAGALIADRMSTSSSVAGARGTTSRRISCRFAADAANRRSITQFMIVDGCCVDVSIPGPRWLRRRRRFALRADGRRRGGRGGFRAFPAPLASSGRRRRGSGCGSGSPRAG